MGRPTKRDETLLKRYRNRVESAKRFRQQEALDDLWDRLIDMYRGKQVPKGLSDEDKVVVNIAFSTINVISPSVAVNYPKIIVEARDANEDDQALLMEHLVNYTWKKHSFQDELRRAVDDFLILGFGWVKSGYRFVEEDVDMLPDEAEAEFEERVAEADEFAMSHPDMAPQLPTDDEIRASLVETKTVVVEDRPFVERVDPHDMFVDPEATTLRDAKWLAQKVTRPLEDVRSDDRYDRWARERAAADSRVADDLRPRSSDEKDVDYQRVTVWEFYDLKAGTMCVFADSGDGFLVDPQKQPYSFGHPFTMLRNYNVPNQFYPMGELEAIEPLQMELNAHRSALLNHRKQNQRKYLYNPRAFDDAGIEALTSDRDNEMVPITGAVPLNEAVEGFPHRALDPQLYQNSEMVLSDVTLVSGVNEYARGALPEIRRTATEASIIQDAANARASDKLAKVERIIGSVASRVVQLIQQYMSEEQVVRIVGHNGHPLWIHLTPEDIAGEFDLDVEAGSTQPKDEQRRRREALELLQTLAPLAQSGIINMPALLRHLLKDGFGIAQPQRFLVEQDPTVAGLGGEPPSMDGPSGADPPNPNLALPAGGGGMQPPVPPEVGGIPDGLVNQLQGQVGLNVGGG